MFGQESGSLVGAVDEVGTAAHKAIPGTYSIINVKSRMSRPNPTQCKSDRASVISGIVHVKVFRGNMQLGPFEVSATYTWSLLT